MKFGTAIAAILMISVAAFASAQEKTMQAKPMMGMKAVPMKAMSKAQWQKMYDQAAMMFMKKDADGIFSYMTPDFTMSTMGKTYSADQGKAEMKKWFGMMKDLHTTFKVTKVSQKGNMAMVTDSFRMWGNMMDPKSKKTVKAVDTGTETATWVKMNGKWMMKKLVSTDEKMTVNGKPMKMG
jgi:hypothetical protein